MLSRTRLTVGILLAMIILSCCTEHRRDSATVIAEQKVAEEAFTSWIREYAAFRADAAPLISECDLLRNHPGWRDMAELIAASPSIEYIEGASEARRKMTRAVADWTRKWHASGSNVLAHYASLKDRSEELERRRLDLLRELDQAHDQQRRAVLSYWAPIIIKSGDPGGHVMAMLKHYTDDDDATVIRLKRQLGVYSIDRFGLYQQMDTQEPP